MSDYRDLGNLSAVDPPYQKRLSCDYCKVHWIGCWDQFCCPECGNAEDWAEDWEAKNSYLDIGKKEHTMESIKEQIATKIMTQGYDFITALELATDCIDRTKQSLKQPVTWYIGCISFDVKYDKPIQRRSIGDFKLINE